MNATLRASAHGPQRRRMSGSTSATTACAIVCAASCCFALVVCVHADPKMAYQESGEGFRVGVKIRILDRADGSVTQFMDDWLREGSPSWGPGGDRLVAHASRDNNNDIFRARVGGERTWLTEHPSYDWAPAWAPAWSPDGLRIAFASGRDGSSQIYVMDVHGDNLRRVTDGPFHADLPSWSPDGDRLAYGTSDLWNFRALRVLEMATGVSRPLTDEKGDRLQPAWSWDGELIAYSTQDRTLDEWHVEVTTVDRKENWRLTADAGPANSGPAWTPDGGVSFVSRRGDRFDVATTGPRGGEITIVASSTTVPAWLAWYNARYFAAETSSVLRPEVWAGLRGVAFAEAAAGR